jgi:complex iron-sulfur molybdoenzyme family reductase subunit gamma
MKKLFTTILSLGLAASAALAANPAVNAAKVSEDVSKLSADSAVWKNAKFSLIKLYPQTTIEFNDKKANEANSNPMGSEALVAAVHDGKNIAINVKWSDKTKDTQAGETSTSYADGFALQFAGVTKSKQPLPYIGMGSIGRPVVVHLQKATEKTYEPNGKGEVDMQINRQQTAVFGKELAEFDAKKASMASSDYERVFVGEGFRTLTEVKDGSIKSNGSMSHGELGWSGVIARPLKDEYVNLNGTVPVSIATWDGSKMGRNGLKNLSSWVAINLDGQKANAAMVAELTTDIKGDAKKGKAAAEANGCNGCHQMTSADPKSFMAPSLSNVGGYSTSAYLRESMVKPSAVIVPGYNRNAHPNMPWYNVEKGKRISTMTDYSHLDKGTLDDIVAYLNTLKAEVK